MNVSDISSLFANGIVASVVVSTDDGFAAASAANDGPVMGDAAYLITATADGTAAVIGKGWSNAATGAAPVALTGYNVDSQTPVLDVQGAVVDEITGLAKGRFPSQGEEPVNESRTQQGHLRRNGRGVQHDLC